MRGIPFFQLIFFDLIFFNARLKDENESDKFTSMHFVFKNSVTQAKELP